MDVWDIREDDFASVSSAVAAADAAGGGGGEMGKAEKGGSE